MSFDFSSRKPRHHIHLFLLQFNILTNRKSKTESKKEFMTMMTVLPLLEINLGGRPKKKDT